MNMIAPARYPHVDTAVIVPDCDTDPDINVKSLPVMVMVAFACIAMPE